jgi:hypothetical protein
MKTRVLQFNICLAVYLVVIFTAGECFAKDMPATLRSELAAQGVSDDAIMGMDKYGIPILCGTGQSAPAVGRNSLSTSATASLPSGTRAYEVIPTIVRSDGRDSFHLEVNANGPVSAVRLDVSFTVVSASGNTALQLRDDGQGGDRSTGDYIFTSEPLHHNTALFAQPNYLFFDTNSPKGLDIVDIGTLSILETNGATYQFLIGPAVGILHTNIAATPVVNVTSDIIVTPHLINIRNSRMASQRFIRSLTSPMEQLTREIYAALPDAYDFLMLFSIDHIEKLPYLTRENFTAGIHSSVQVKYSGTGLGMYDSSAFYGSAGRLQGINVLDTLERGIYAQNATHEVVHQWCAFISFSFGLSDDSAHFSFRSNVGSLVGGQRWIDNGGATFTVDCDEGRGGAHYASPMDKYMMGLIDGGQVPVLHSFSSSIQSLPCDGMVSNVPVTVSISDIQQRHGVRTPGPTTAQRNFSIGFIAESHDRFLTSTELTFYEILADHYTKPLPTNAPAPYVGFGWVPIGKFFGEGTTWTSYHPSLVTPTLSIQHVAGQQHRMFGNGFAGETYTLQGSGNLRDWAVLRTTNAASNGNFEFLENIGSAAGSSFYRVRWR